MGMRCDFHRTEDTDQQVQYFQRHYAACNCVLAGRAVNRRRRVTWTLHSAFLLYKVISALSSKSFSGLELNLWSLKLSS